MLLTGYLSNFDVIKIVKNLLPIMPYVYEIMILNLPLHFEKIRTVTTLLTRRFLEKNRPADLKELYLFKSVL